MRGVEIDGHADLAIIAAQSFQFMLTAADQLATLANIHRHLRVGGRLAVHVELAGRDWLAGLPEVAPAPADRLTASLRDSTTGAEWQSRYAWSLDRLAEVVTFHVDWLRIADGQVVEHLRQEEMSLKVIGVIEMEHVLLRAGFDVVERREWVGGTSGSHDARQLLWIARPGESQ
jgi:hypothetical protein